MSINTERMRPGAVNCLADVLRLLGEPNRLHILCALGGDCKTVSELISETGIEQSNASFHLRFLRQAALVNVERRGRNMYYSVHDKELLGLIESLSRWVNRALPLNVKAEAEIRSKLLRKRNAKSI